MVKVLLRIIGAQRKRPDQRMLSYNHGLEKIRCESIVANKDVCGWGRLSEWVEAGCQSESCSEIFRVSGGGGSVGRRYCVLETYGVGSRGVVEDGH